MAQCSFGWTNWTYIHSGSCVLRIIEKEFKALAVNSGQEEKVLRCAMLLKVFLYGVIIIMCVTEFFDWSNNES